MDWKIMGYSQGKERVNMPVTCKEDKRQLTALVDGELDHHGAKSVMEELDRRIDLVQPRELTLDLGGLTFTDSSGIAVLLRAHRRMGQVRGAMRVVNTPDQAGRVFKAAGLERIIRFE